MFWSQKRFYGFRANLQYARARLSIFMNMCIIFCIHFTIDNTVVVTLTQADEPVFSVNVWQTSTFAIQVLLQRPKIIRVQDEHLCQANIVTT